MSYDPNSPLAEGFSDLEIAVSWLGRLPLTDDGQFAEPHATTLGNQIRDLYYYERTTTTHEGSMDVEPHVTERLQLLGTLVVRNETGEAVLNPGATQDALDFAQHFVRITTGRAIKDYVTEDLRNTSLLDDLTGILNRRGIEEGFGDWLENPRAAVAIILMDMDNFKQVNDRLGHQRGDDLLRDIAVLLSANSRTEDIVGRPQDESVPEPDDGSSSFSALVGRLGGDEFVVVLHLEESDLNDSSAPLSPTDEPDGYTVHTSEQERRKSVMTALDRMNAYCHRIDRQFQALLSLPQNADVAALGVSISIGGTVAHMSTPGYLFRGHLDASDRLMYERKRENKVNAFMRRPLSERMEIIGHIQRLRELGFPVRASQFGLPDDIFKNPDPSAVESNG